MVHALHCQKLFLEQLLSLNEEGSSLVDGAIDILAGPLRLQLNINLPVNLIFDILLKLYFAKCYAHELLFNDCCLMLSIVLLLHACVGAIEDVKHDGLILLK